MFGFTFLFSYFLERYFIFFCRILLQSFEIYCRILHFSAVKYDAVKNYLIELKKYKIIDPVQCDITKYGENKILNGNIDSANFKIKEEYKGNLVCKHCGEIFDKDDFINRFYLNNFELDRECFQKIINNYRIRQNF